MSAEAELVTLVQQTFPNWGSETAARLEAIGVYGAAAWSAGGPALRSRGIPVPDALHIQLVTPAAAVAQARQGGTRFLAHLRGAVGDDSAFLAILTGVGSVYARFRAGRSQAAQPAPAAEPEGPSEISGFEVGQLLGKGNMGQVYKARQKSLDRVVALKILDRSLAEDDETFVERFTSEAKAVAQLNHVNIVGVIDQGTCDRTGVQFIAFEFIDGQTVQQLQQERGGKLAEREALGICLAVLEALNCAEQRGIVHRDVKPDNILIGRDGTPKLADLGLAKRRFEQTADKELTQSGLVVGTPQYMAPEQAMGLDDVDTRADLYSLGICLFHFLTGSFPFTSETPLGVITQHINQDVPDPRTRDPGLSQPVAQLVLSMAARDPNHRYPSAFAAAVDVERALEGQPLLGPARAGQQQIQRLNRSGAIRIGASGRWMAKAVMDGLDAPPIELIPPGGLGPGAAELWKYERSGHHEHLASAQREFTEQSEAQDPEIQAHGRAGLARVHLLNGDPGKAKTLGEGALEIDPDCRSAAEVLIALERGDAAHAGFAAGMAQVTALIRAARFEEARERAAAVRRDFPSEPHPHLALAVAAKRQNDEAGFQEAVQLAWALFPSKAHGDQPLGAGFDASCMGVLADYGWAALTSGEEERVRLTTEDQDEKSNLVAGALRMAVALGHAALAQGEPPPELVRRLLFNIARSVGGLQHFTAAQDMLRSLQRLDPSDAEQKQYEEAARAIAGFQGAKTELQTGIRPRRGNYACPIGGALRTAAKKRAKALAAQRTACETEVTAACARVAEIGLDATLKTEVQRAAAALGVEDPYAPLLEIESSQAELEVELATLAESPEEPEEEKKSGFFARLKGAAKATGRAAKHGQLKLKEAHLRSRHTAEVKALGERIVRELGRYDYQHPELQALTRKARRLTTTVEALKAEEDRLKRVQEWLAR